MKIWLTEALVSAFFFGISGFLFKITAAEKLNAEIVLAASYFSGAILFFIMLQQHHSQWLWSWRYGINGLMIATGTSLGKICINKALKLGPSGLTYSLVGTNVILVAILSITAYHERPDIGESIAILLLLLAIFLLQFDPQQKLNINNKTWYGLVLLAIVFIFFRAGGLKISQEQGLNNILVLFYAYALSFIGFFSKSFLKIKATISNYTKKTLWHSVSIGLLMGVAAFLGLYFYSVALQTGPASIVAPLFSLRSLVILILSTIIYREKLSQIQGIAIGLIISSALFINI